MTLYYVSIGPNVYNPNKKFGQSVESNKVQAPSYSIYGRSKNGGFDEDFKKVFQSI